SKNASRWRHSHLFYQAVSTGGYKPSFTFYGNEGFLLLRDDKGQGPTVSLSTGKLKTVWNGQKRL
ncbi:MAG: hypothetical protein Q4C89_04445, partial [Deinococcus sp.]|uniref:hypothetical protein n=1 Tax=Deinococcus sp. TaxID=47478 RepID=UPI0026DD1B9B